MSKKQQIYTELLRQSVPIARGILSSKLVYGRSRKLAYELCELTHNLYVSILEESFTDHDIWFLNVQARSYCETNIRGLSYDPIARLIQELFQEVPEEMKQKLKWTGPLDDHHERS